MSPDRGERPADLPLRDSDLVEFLLARFDEDEEAARFVQASPAPTNRALVAHVLRDAAAKRQLVEYFRDLEARGTRGDTMDHALRLIGQTYADHPHYRDEWRPWEDPPGPGRGEPLDGPARHGA